MTLDPVGSGDPASTPAEAAPPPAAHHGPVALDVIALSLTNPRTRHNRARLLELLDSRDVMKRMPDMLAAAVTEPAEDGRQALAKLFDSQKFTELVLSVAAHDVNQPVLLRPLPGSRLADTQPDGHGKRPEWELVAGERRYLAARFAGRKTIPALAKAMTDQEVLEFQLIENLQREDLHPMEEAEGADATGFAIGDRVRFKQDLKGHGGKLRKVSGREGTIEAKVGDRAFSVRFGTKAHELATADYTELVKLEPEGADDQVGTAAVPGFMPQQAWPFPQPGTAGKAA